MANDIATQQQTKVPSILTGMAQQYGVTVAELDETIRFTVMDPKSTYAEYLSFLAVAKNYGLNPLTREIYAFPKKGGGIVPVVSIDGWIRIVNDRPDLDGFEFEEHNDDKGKLVATTCKIHRRGRNLPIVVTEYLDECIRQTEPWKMARRMLRHKAFIQCARYAFGFSGIYDDDEAHDMHGGPVGGRRSTSPAPKPPGGIIDHDPNTGEIIETTVTSVETEMEARRNEPDPVEEKQPDPKPPEEKKADPKPPVETKKAETKKSAKDESKADPIDELKDLLRAAKTPQALDDVVSNHPKTKKPTRGMVIYEELSENDKEVVKALYRECKAKLTGDGEAATDQQQDQQQDQDGADQPEDLVAEFAKFCDSAADLDALEACMSHFEERIAELPAEQRRTVEDIFTKAEERIKNAAAPADADGEGAEGDMGVEGEPEEEGAAEEKNPEDMTIDEYVAYAEAYIAEAKSADALKKRFFGESQIRTGLKLPNDVSNRLRALRTAKHDELTAAGKA